MTRKRLENERYLVCVRRTSTEAYRHFFGRRRPVLEAASLHAKSALEQTQTWVKKSLGVKEDRSKSRSMPAGTCPKSRRAK